jgi:copper homeostasis protein
MQYDIRLCRELGFEGVVTGMLMPDGSIDVPRMQVLSELAYPMDVTFHRAFDRCRDPLQSLEDVIACGCTRILTSGQVPNAFDGRELIRQLVEKAGDRIIIMPGSGVRSANIKELKEYTGAKEMHSSARKKLLSSMQFTTAGMQEQLQHTGIDEEEVKAMRKAMEL